MTNGHNPLFLKVLHLMALLSVSISAISVAYSQSSSDIYRLASRGDAKKIQALLLEGFPVDQPDAYGRTPLNFAANSGKESVVSLLIKNGARVNGIPGGQLPLNSAISGQQESTMRLLVKAGADINKADSDGITPMHVAVLQRVEYVKFLAKNGGDLKAVSKEGRTLLHQCAAHAYVDTMKFLIDSGVGANAVDQKGNTPLHELASNSLKIEKENRVEAARILILQNCDPSQKNKEGLDVFSLLEKNEGMHEEEKAAFLKVLKQYQKR